MCTCANTCIFPVSKWCWTWLYLNKLDSKYLNEKKSNGKNYHRELWEIHKYCSKIMAIIVCEIKILQVVKYKTILLHIYISYIFFITLITRNNQCYLSLTRTVFDLRKSSVRMYDTWKVLQRKTDFSYYTSYFHPTLLALYKLALQLEAMALSHLSFHEVVPVVAIPVIVD